MSLNHHQRPVPAAAKRRPRGSRQDGYVMTVFGLLLVPLLLMAGLAVDVGYWYNRASDIQKAADAAALAGVVWLPNLTTATSVALDVAKRNGFDDAASNITVTVSKSTKAPRRLKVTIIDSTVGSFFYKSLKGNNISLGRSSFAEYVTPVPMGSPRNFFGTGRLITADPELLYQSINPYCTNKVNGDRNQSGHFDSTRGSITSCPAAATNPDYQSIGYETYIEAPVGRTSNIEVRLYDARYSTATITDTLGESCTYTYPNSWQYPTSNATLTGPAIYQTRATTTSTVWSATTTLPVTQTYSMLANRVRYQRPSTTYCADDPIDSKRQTGDESFTFSLRSADSTPLDDTDNPLVAGCTQTYSPTTAFETYRYLMSTRWNTLCTITTAMPSGRYILSGKNGAPGTLTADGSNQYGVVAKYTSASGDGLCDGRTDVTCPRVYGKDAISVYANTSAAAASFYLAEIGSEHIGKKLKLELWDPGEGGSTLEILSPTGSNTWAPVSFSWKVDTGTPATTSSLSVTNSVFNGKLVEITIDLAGYAPPTDNEWWKIRYTFTSGAVTDRTTWSARILGDPVHLIEEN